jgi:2-keto-4-pentenoate hydratase/2-oxohepta-3-ene-1,7-dioic acid hydratase in catechol pathway
MKLCRFNEGRLGVVDGDQIRDVTAATHVLPPLIWPVPPGDHAVRHLDRLLGEVQYILPSSLALPLSEVRLLSPVANPSKVIAAPLNYQLHTDEVGRDVQIHTNTHTTTFEGYRNPIAKLGLFLKATSSVVGPSEGVELAFADRRSDHEVELAVVIGSTARHVAEEDALDVVAGYAVALDMTVRGTEDRSMRKSADSYTVLGPWLVTRDELADPTSLRLSVAVNGERRQEATTAWLTVGVRELIALASRWYTLYPGDVILTGTPDGVGPVNPGDAMTAFVEHVGEMVVSVREPVRAFAADRA